ncbi:MAG: polyphosphate polymerase domain-containing protein [Gemmataceae bacterium]|nr:polyphosphate polymerase domain-containing protein [Gemmataceae bacterium]
MMLHDPQVPRDNVSPALVSGAAAAFELKFLVEPELAEQIELWARRYLTPDPHGDPALGGAYRLHNLYLDTPALDIFRRLPGQRSRKFRLRRYGADVAVYLERKTKRRDRVRKRRTAVAEGDLERFHAPTTDPDWSGAWFHRLVHARRLQPACRITYDRVALVGGSDQGPLRLTFDRNLRAVPCRSWHVADAGAGIALVPDRVIVELKYRTCVPALFKQLITAFRLQPRSASKYRLAMAAWHAPTVGTADSLSETG